MISSKRTEKKRDAETLRLIVKHRMNVWKGQYYWMATVAFTEGKTLPGRSIHTAVRRAVQALSKNGRKFK